jgi:hypothetical protein
MPRRLRAQTRPSWGHRFTRYCETRPGANNVASTGRSRCLISPYGATTKGFCVFTTLHSGAWRTNGVKRIGRISNPCSTVYASTLARWAPISILHRRRRLGVSPCRCEPGAWVISSARHGPGAVFGATVSPREWRRPISLILRKSRGRNFSSSLSLMSVRTNRMRWTKSCAARGRLCRPLVPRLSIRSPPKKAVSIELYNSHVSN